MWLLFEGGDYSKKYSIHAPAKIHVTTAYMYNVHIKIHVIPGHMQVPHITIHFAIILKTGNHMLQVATDILMHVVMHSWTNSRLSTT